MEMKGKVLAGDIIPIEQKDFQIYEDENVIPNLQAVGGAVHRVARSGEMRVFSEKKRSKIEINTYSQSYWCEVNDVVVGTITQRSQEFYLVDIGTHTYAYLNSLYFEGATKRNKPHLEVGDAISARVMSDDVNSRPQLSCISPHHKKGWATGEAFFGQLFNGYIFPLSKNYCYKLLNLKEAEVNLVNILQEIFEFKIFIGLNGKIWIKGTTLKDTISLVNAITQAENLSSTEITDLAEELKNELK